MKKEKKKKSESSEVQVLVDGGVKDIVISPEKTCNPSQESNGRLEDSRSDEKKKKKKEKKKKKGEEEKIKDTSPLVICEDKIKNKKTKHKLTESSVADETQMQNGIKTESKNKDEDVLKLTSVSMETKKRKVLSSEESELLVDASSKSEKKQSTTVSSYDLFVYTKLGNMVIFLD